MKRLIFIAMLGACASSEAPDPGLEHLAITKVAPTTVIPGTQLVVTGESFVDDPWGTTTLHLVGGAVDEQWPAKFVDFNTLNVTVDGAKLDAIGAGDFTGTAEIDVIATSDGKTYRSGTLDTTLTFAETLTPAPTSVVDGVHFVNDQIDVDGDGFLLGGDEGKTVAHVTGCFLPDAGGSCVDVAAVDIPLVPREPLSRQKASFPFAPKIAGIEPGQFTGQVAIVNQQTGKPPKSATAIATSFTLVTSQIFSVSPTSASLGQYVFANGGGFVGGETGADTELELDGNFTKAGAGGPVPVTMNLVPEFVEGKLVRYVLNTDDELGHALDLRKDTGSFTGTITPIVTYHGDTVRGVSTSATFSIAPVRQVVFLNFTPSYVEGLRDFGLRAVDAKIRERILAVCRATYGGVNMDFRTDPVTDFAEYENVDLVGVDPNDMGLFGYDNSPGKDNGNVRLYDRLGGVNAMTQQDGYPGYGGVFVRSLMGFSKHPGSFAQSIEGSDPTFDQIFDHFRGDVDGGTPITASDLSGGLDAIAEGSGCPAGDRKTQMGCAVFVVGNLIGGTLAHEIGHSLGLAYPFGEGFHDTGDQPNRLMDAGGDRPFPERAELLGQGPGVFCDDEFTYLQGILPSKDPAPAIARPTCF